MRQIISSSMNPIARHMTTWLTSTNQGVATSSSIAMAEPDPLSGRPAEVPEPATPASAYVGAWLPKWDAPLLGEAKVKIAEAKRTNASMKASPGSSLAPVDAIDIDIEPEAEGEPMGNQYINSIAKLITAWINA